MIWTRESPISYGLCFLSFDRVSNGIENFILIAFNYSKKKSSHLNVTDEFYAIGYNSLLFQKVFFIGWKRIWPFSMKLQSERAREELQTTFERISKVGTINDFNQTFRGLIKSKFFK